LIALIWRVLTTSIAMQYEENKASIDNLTAVMAGLVPAIHVLF
jgi:hypothetical protein